MAEDDEYTPAQKQKIARHFMMVAPHGEVRDLAKGIYLFIKINFFLLQQKKNKNFRFEGDYAWLDFGRHLAANQHDRV